MTSRAASRPGGGSQQFVRRDWALRVELGLPVADVGLAADAGNDQLPDVPRQVQHEIADGVHRRRRPRPELIVGELTDAVGDPPECGGELIAKGVVESILQFVGHIQHPPLLVSALAISAPCAFDFTSTRAFPSPAPLVPTASTNAAVRRSQLCLERIVWKRRRRRAALAKFGIHAFLVPAVLLHVLHPLEVAHGYAAGVGVDIRQERDPLLEEDGVRLRVGWVVRSLEDDTSPARRRHWPSSAHPQRGGDEYVTRLGEESVGRKGLAARETCDGLLLARVLGECADVKARSVADRAADIAHRDDLTSGLVKSRGRRADVAEALDGVREIADLLADALEQALGAEEQSAPRGRVAAQRAAEFDRLAGDDARRVPVELLVLIHDPGHRLGLVPMSGAGTSV